MSLAARIAALFLLGVILLTPVWLVEYPPLLDYPNHLASSFVLAHLSDPRFKFAEIYYANWGPYPYVAMDVILLALQRFIPVELAGRIFLSLCLLALPAAVWFFLHYANPRHDMLALWSLPFSYNIFLLNGFLSYYLSVAVCFAAVGLWLQYLDRPRILRWIGLTAVFTVLYFVHAFGFAAAAIVVTTHALLKRQLLRQIVLLWLVFLPSIVFFLGSHLIAGAAQDMTFLSVRSKVGWLLGVLRGHSRQHDLITFLILAVCVAGALWRNVDLQWNHDWLGVTAALFAMFWVLPTGYREIWDIDIRVLPILYLVILAGARVGHRARWIAVGAVLLFLIHTGETTYQFVAEQPFLASLAGSFGAVPANARVLPLIEAEPRSSHLPYFHFWAYGVIRRGWLSPYLFTIPSVQPLRLRDVSYVPVGGLQPNTAEPPDWERVQATYDYVWAYNFRRFSPELDKIGERVFSEGILDVYRIERHASTLASPALKP